MNSMMIYRNQIFLMGLVFLGLSMSGCKSESVVQNNVQQQGVREPETGLNHSNRTQSQNGVDCGGIVDKSYDAPKTLTSTRITGFSAKFYILDDDDDALSDWYQYELREENGKYILKESSKYKIQEVVSGELFSQVQALIVKHNLVELNGTDRVTSGLPTEYQACSFAADYASGERLSFRQNNNPHAAWAKEMSDLLRNTFIALGHRECMPSYESRTIADCSILFAYEDKTYTYDVIKDASNPAVKRLRKMIVSNKSGEKLSENSADISNAFFESFSEFVQTHNIKRFQDGVLPSEPDAQKDPGFGYSILITYGNFRQIAGESDEKSKYDELVREIPALISFMEQYLGASGTAENDH